MPINPKTTGLHHVAFRSMDFSITKKFYLEILGFPLALDTEEILGFMAGNIFIGFKKAIPNHLETLVHLLYKYYYPSLDLFSEKLAQRLSMEF